MSSAQELEKMANVLRKDVLQMVFTAGAGHIAGPLSSAEIFACLYFGGVVDKQRDKIVLSCGHYCPVLYAALVRSGELRVDELKTFMRMGSRLPGHPERGVTPGVHVSAGPLGQGVSVATGMALALKMKSDKERVYCVLSDGELQEGQVWEAFNFAVAKRLNNLIYILDRNQIQIEHMVKELVITEEEGRLEAFGLNVISVDGNKVEQVNTALMTVTNTQDRPTIIVCNTIGGKGVSFMENQPKWHDKVPSREELKIALEELGVNHD